MCAEQLNQDKPHSARMYDYWLGGRDNYQCDREAAAAVEKVFPHSAETARINRDFMKRAIEHLARDRGVSQFLDIGTGIPTEPNPHQVAQTYRPHARVVYVDNDPIVLAHARALLTGSEEGHTAYVHADATDTAAILGSTELREALDLSQPVAVSLLALLHFLPDDRNPHRMVTALMNAVPAGSFLVISHATSDFRPDQLEAAAEVYRRHGMDAQIRTYDEIAAFFTGLELIEPGIVPPHRWHPDLTGGEPLPGTDERVCFYAGIGRKH
ncbi:SAM-dependent methyltransferase [Nocardia terpenica]|uniref:Methyltransferase n=1 Tax=Nocardia terpenica TaxID=455432 RepID=A0A164HHA7_9NOCA|nr:SAM-dependent methyltransferase [Nocardia terpenica]KZM68513.1 methyltransferase [Nocardia terpenica]MBF6064962.1 SAM-dependent methyltransferase [Nocardia terpenica]MBF6115234.1 SAM-dependent methyltransferase [Nocardia terpenica]MBF6122556.1 SAM-dependent methyltransferase [Nocardia terpenica]NQE88533.1 SAM-dependent methyltransferase [Nocardia terpenica]